GRSASDTAAVAGDFAPVFPFDFPPLEDAAWGSGVSIRSASVRTVSGGGAMNTLPQKGQRTFLPRDRSRIRILSSQKGQESENVGVSDMGADSVKRTDVSGSLRSGCGLLPGPDE